MSLARSGRVRCAPDASTSTPPLRCGRDRPGRRGGGDVCPAHSRRSRSHAGVRGGRRGPRCGAAQAPGHAGRADRGARADSALEGRSESPPGGRLRGPAADVGRRVPEPRRDGPDRRGPTGAAVEGRRTRRDRVPRTSAGPTTATRGSSTVSSSTAGCCAPVRCPRMWCSPRSAVRTACAPCCGGLARWVWDEIDAFRGGRAAAAAMTTPAL
jgi:hypothetical protein